MKIRIKGNSVRLRLTKSEVLRLETEGSVSDSTAFPNGIFGYELRADAEISELTAVFENNTITIRMPEAQAKSWEQSDQIGHEHRI